MQIDLSHILLSFFTDILDPGIDSWKYLLTKKQEQKQVSNGKLPVPLLFC